MDENKLNSIVSNFLEIEKKLSNLSEKDFSDYAKLSKEYSNLKPLVEKIKEYKKLNQELIGVDEIIDSNDEDLKKEALEEKSILNEKIISINEELKFMLIPKDESDEKNAIIEIRAGTGGEEAALFASDLLRMYTKYSEIKSWNTEIMDLSETDHDGVKEVILKISGNNVFGDLKFESGTHRVQRVPLTESGGRIHTSAATVAVLPEASDVDVEILEKDLTN